MITNVDTAVRNFAAYGEGADCYEESCRVYRPDAEATHVLVCYAAADEVRDPRSGQPVSFPTTGLLVNDLVGCRAGEPYFRYDPPFDHVLLIDPSISAMPRIVVPLADVRFELREVLDSD